MLDPSRDHYVVKHNYCPKYNCATIVANADVDATAPAEIPERLPASRIQHRKVDQLFKTADEIAHDRMAALPFVSYDAFPTATFVTYGSTVYDAHEKFIGKAALAKLFVKDLFEAELPPVAVYEAVKMRKTKFLRE